MVALCSRVRAALQEQVAELDQVYIDLQAMLTEVRSWLQTTTATLDASDKLTAAQQTGEAELLKYKVRGLGA